MFDFLYSLSLNTPKSPQELKEYYTKLNIFGAGEKPGKLKHMIIDQARHKCNVLLALRWFSSSPFHFQIGGAFKNNVNGGSIS